MSSPTLADSLTPLSRDAGCVFAEQEAHLIAHHARTPAHAADLAERRAAGTPLEHVLGWARLRGVTVRVDPGVFLPRPRSALLADLAVGLLPERGVAVDLCCGSGILAAILIAARPHARVHAVDLDPNAVACARRNLPAHRVHHGDLCAALPPRLRGRVDVLVANVPHVPTDRLRLLPAEARLYEAPLALDGGPDGLDVLRRLARQAPGRLAPTGTVLVETAAHQAGTARKVLADAGLRPEVRTAPTATPPSSRPPPGDPRPRPASSSVRAGEPVRAPATRPASSRVSYG
ncbi:putative protein N(5)-glutamine methyltransferase [Nocardiopsis sp. N85]|uniref:putative protein N(5)-glutamine methyltransferase n=1 Tax=Nocardiopsis sp. N85 TaxID=3029400 RepID=UPI00237F97DD|nr:putative protein N(5)-glutamine methyltransferase [Nocardiopsis sp. N85]MDE3724191.1 putative protein N(5)-glutamine methyltransferase [Nocardiopsis sp. N85]